MSTKDQNFLAMSHLQQIGFRLDTVVLYGLGERTADLVLKEGKYVIYATANDF